MLATVINSLALSSALVAAGVKARVLTAVRMEPIGEFYNKWRAIECMEAGEVVIMSAGTGNPFFTTDTGSSLRGIEIEADVMLKGTRRPGEGPDSHEVPRHHLRRSAEARSESDGPHCHLHVQRE
jgi:uridylate kinase